MTNEELETARLRCRVVRLETHLCNILEMFETTLEGKMCKHKKNICYCNERLAIRLAKLAAFTGKPARCERCGSPLSALSDDCQHCEVTHAN